MLVGLLVIVLSTGCADHGSGASTGTRLRGLHRREPPAVGNLSLPDASHGNAEFPIRASRDGLLLMYFGYTNCPDICPGTLAALKLAIRKLSPRQAGRVQVAMVTVDPTRDTGTVLSGYLQHFFRDAHALRTEDQARIKTLADAFGVSYQVSTNSKGEEEVGHSALSFAVDDRGRIVDTWPYGFSYASIASDLRILLASSRRD